MAGGAAGTTVRAVRHLGTAGVITAMVLAVVLLVFGRGGDLDPAAAGEITAAASLDVIDTEVERQASGSPDFTVADDNALLDVGDVLRTDATGFGQVDWSDGSLVRLDVNTTMAIVALDGDSLAPSITARLDEGRVWNRVQSVTGTHGNYEVQTAVGTAAVRGTGFSIACDAAGVCTIIVWDGAVEVTTPDGGVVRIEAGETVVIAPADDAEDPDARFVEVSRDSSTPEQLEESDDWVATNVRLDDETGRFGADREGCSATLDGRNARLATTPDTAIELDADQDAEALGLTVAPLDEYSIRVAMLGQEFTAGEGRVTSATTEFRRTVAISDYAVFGVGLYEVAAVTTGVDCRLDGFVLIGGRSPFTTVLGILGTILSVLGLALLSAALRGRKPGKASVGRRVRGAVSGLLAGLGLAILVQQFGVFALTTTLVAGWAGGGAAIGALTPRATTPTVSAPPPPDVDGRG